MPSRSRLPVGPTVADFWGWSLSDLLDNTERGVLAEFILAAALGIAVDGLREGWAAWELTTQRRLPPHSATRHPHDWQCVLLSASGFPLSACPSFPDSRVVSVTAAGEPQS